jgi:putative isomerase
MNHRTRRIPIFILAGLGLGALLAAPARSDDGQELSRFFKDRGFKENVVKPAAGILKHPYVVPAGPYFQLFDWDMYFMSVALSYDGIGQPFADSVKDFLEFVDENANRDGYAPREIAPDGLWALPEMCKPFLAQAALRATRTLGSPAWLEAKDTGEGKKTAYEKLCDMMRFWENTRRAPDGLFRWYNGVESGVDNNPAVSDEPALVTEGVDLQCYIYREYLALARLAEALKKPADAARYQAKAEALAKLARNKMWSPKDGTFWNVDSRNGSFVRVKTWTNLTPLWAGIATPEQAQRMIKGHLLKEFWSSQGLRTLAPDEPLYDAKAGYWRGPVWVISDYLLMHGLMNYGHTAEAQEVARKTVALLLRDLRATKGMNENYNPDTGEPAANGQFISWNLLAEHMLEEASAGTDPTRLELK